MKSLSRCRANDSMMNRLQPPDSSFLPEFLALLSFTLPLERSCSVRSRWTVYTPAWSSLDILYHNFMAIRGHCDRSSRLACNWHSALR